MDLQDKIVLVTGASRGLGAGIALNAAKQGAHVIAVARTVGALEALDDQIQAEGGAATLVPLDLTEREAVRQMGASIHERWGGVDLWCHTAIHGAPLTPANHIDAKDLDKSLSVNFLAAQNAIESIDPLLRAKSGQAIYLTDGNATGKFFGTYGSTKAAQVTLFDHWAAEMAASGFHVTAFEPKPMPTALRARFFPGEERDGLADPMEEAKRLLATL